MTHAKKLRQLLAQKDPILAPGCFDALSALMIEQAGFDCAYLSGVAIIAGTSLLAFSITMQNFYPITNLEFHFSSFQNEA